MKLSYTQCKEFVKQNGRNELESFLDSVNDQPEWLVFMGEIDSIYEIKSINQGGCASGAYMPAVTYYKALETMGNYGDSVLDYIEIQLGELPQPKKGESWSGLAVFYCSCAVELWCGHFYDTLDSISWE